MRKSKRVLALLWALLLFGFTVYAALDTFVLERSYAVVEEQAATQEASAGQHRRLRLQGTKDDTEEQATTQEASVGQHRDGERLRSRGSSVLDFDLGLRQVFTWRAYPQFKSINSLALSLLHSPTLTSIHEDRKSVV